MLTELIKIKGDWQEVVNDCRVTVGKSDLDHVPSAEFRRQILIAEHSPIRDISVKWRWSSIKSWIATHYSRHKWECYIRSQRSDRTGIPRDELPQAQKVDFVGEANMQHLIDTSRKRLCNQADPETRKYWESLKVALYYDLPELSDVMVPNCIYRGGCPELHPCGFCNWFREIHNIYELTDIASRYEKYNHWFWGDKDKVTDERLSED